MHSSHPPSMVVNIESVRCGSPDSRTTRTASATASLTDSPVPDGATEKATIMASTLPVSNEATRAAVTHPTGPAGPNLCVPVPSGARPAALLALAVLTLAGCTSAGDPPDVDDRIVDPSEPAPPEPSEPAGPSSDPGQGSDPALAAVAALELEGFSEPPPLVEPFGQISPCPGLSDQVVDVGDAPFARRELSAGGTSKVTVTLQVRADEADADAAAGPAIEEVIDCEGEVQVGPLALAYRGGSPSDVGDEAATVAGTLSGAAVAAEEVRVLLRSGNLLVGVVATGASEEEARATTDAAVAALLEDLDG